MEYFKNFLLIILFNLFGIIFCQDPFDELNDNCIKLLLYYNSTEFRSSEIRNNFGLNDKTLSMATIDKIILYDCLNNYNNSNFCSYRNAKNPNNLDDCKNKEKDSNNNLCCFLKEEYYNPISDNSTFHSSCIQVDEYEYQRFKSNNYSTIINRTFNNMSNYYGWLECYDKIYVKGINKFLIFFILFFLF